MILAAPMSLNQYIDMYHTTTIKGLQLSMLGYPNHLHDISTNTARDRTNEERNKEGGKEDKKKGAKSKGGNKQKPGNDRRKPEESETE